MNTVSDQVVLLTGASGGIGRQLALALDHAGARLLLVGRDQNKLQDLARQLKRPPLILPADLRKPEDRLQLREAVQRLGRLDILIHGAGVSEFALLEQTDDEALHSMLETNLLTPMLLTRDLLPLLQRSSQPRILLIGSTFGSIGYAGFAGYCASKFGLRGFAEALRRELAGSAICVQYLSPRATATTMNSPQVNALNAALGNRVDSPSEVALQALKLLQSGKASNRFLGWPERFFIVLNHLFPRLVDRALGSKLALIRQFARQ